MTPTTPEQTFQKSKTGQESSLREQSLQGRKSLGATWRAILIGTILTIPNVYWILDSAGQGYPTTISLYFNVIFCIFILTGTNLALKRITPRLAFSQGELLTIYVMLAIASSLAGHDVLRVLIPMIPYAFWHATPENDWTHLFHRYIPDWIAVKDKRFLTEYYRGETSFYQWEIIEGWITTTLTWGGFLCALVLAMVFINALVRKQWTEHEKLSYPIIQLPLEMTNFGRANLLTNKVMWLGFGIAGAIDILNGLHHLYPTVPSLGGRLYDLRPFFTQKPWSAIGWTPIAVFPFAVGMAFFIPLDLSFSCWFFYLFWKVERIFGDALGIRGMPNFPFTDEQSFGAYIGLFVIAIIATRKHLAYVIQHIFKPKQANDSDEPMSYRGMLICLILCLIFLTIFCNAAGMSIWAIIIFFGIYYAISTAVTRMRAELGSPVHDLHFIGPDEMMPRIFGTRFLGPRNLTMLAYLFSINRAYRGHPMPHILEGFKLAERTRISNRWLLVAMCIAVVIGTYGSFWAFYHISYVEGARDWFAGRPFNRLQSWLTSPRAPDVPAIVAMIIGFLITGFLMIMRIKLFWWPFHPAGFAISSSWSMNVFWFSIFVSSVIKWLILKQGGINLHRKLIPFFLGLILGEFIIGSGWSLIGITLNKPMYRFLF